MQRLFALLVLLTVALGGAAEVLADQRDPRLDGLFLRLQRTADAREAQQLEQMIWGIWTRAGDGRVDHLMRQGTRALARRDLERALEHFDRVVEAAPDFAEGWNKRATVHYLMGDFTASVRDIQRTLDLEPRHFGALSGLGLIYDALDEPKAALRSMEAALELNPHLDGTRRRVEELRRMLRGRRL